MGIFKSILRRFCTETRAESYSLTDDIMRCFFVLFCFFSLSSRDWSEDQEFWAQSKIQYTCSSKPLIRNKQPRNCIPFYYGRKKYSKSLFRVLNWKGGKKFSLSLTHKIWELPVGWGFISGGNSRVLSSQEI